MSAKPIPNPFSQSSRKVAMLPLLCKKCSKRKKKTICLDYTVAFENSIKITVSSALYRFHRFNGKTKRIQISVSFYISDSVSNQTKEKRSS